MSFPINIEAVAEPALMEDMREIAVERKNYGHNDEAESRRKMGGVKSPPILK